VRIQGAEGLDIADDEYGRDGMGRAKAGSSWRMAMAPESRLNPSCLIAPAAMTFSRTYGSPASSSAARYPAGVPAREGLQAGVDQRDLAVAEADEVAGGSHRPLLVLDPDGVELRVVRVNEDHGSRSWWHFVTYESGNRIEMNNTPSTCPRCSERRRYSSTSAGWLTRRGSDRCPVRWPCPAPLQHLDGEVVGEDGMIAAIVLVRREARRLAWVCGWYSRRRTTLSTRSRVRAETLGWLLRHRETVPMPTPASRARS